MKKKMLISAAIMLCLCMVACGGTKEAAESGVTTDTEGSQVPAETTVDTDNTDDTAKESEEQKMTESALPKGIDPADYYKFVQFELPENFRQAAVDHMKKMATLEWTPAQDYSFGLNRENWKYTFELKAGTIYTGLPYSSGNRAYGEFIKNIEENGGKFADTGAKDAQIDATSNFDIWGVECNSSTNAAIQQFSPVAKSIAKQYMPSFEEFIGITLGDIKVTPGLKKTGEIIAQNDKDTIYEAYALLKLGDIIMQKNEVSGLCHVRMISVEPVVVRNPTGKINPSKSYVKCVEQTDAFDKTRTDGVLTTWRIDKTYTFGELYTKNYLPITLEVYNTNVSVIPYIALDKEITPEMLSRGSLSGVVSSDYPIQYCYLDILDKDGKVVSRAAQHVRNGVDSIPLRNYAYDLFKDLPDGDYTFVIDAGLNCGSAELCRVDFTYSK